MSDFNEEHVYMSFPNKNALRCITCQVDFMKIRDVPMKPSYYWQISKCRMIIQIIQEIIASPVPRTTGLIYVIGAKELIENDKLKTQLQYLDILYGKPQEITTDIYTMCLNYTIQCRIASLWNKVGQYYVHGFEFYTLIKEFDALKMKITMNDENAKFHLYAQKIKIPFIKLEDFGLPNSLIAKFLADVDGIINLTKYCLLVHVLPSMKTGRVISVFKKIPSHSPFKNYTQLQKYWIDMYDYRLPQTEEGIVYYEIKFFSGTSSFIYPSICVAIGPILSYPLAKANKIISQFINDLYCTLNKIYNKQLCIHNNNKGQSHQLISPGNNTEKINVQSHNCLSSQNDVELIINNKIDKYSSNSLEYITRCKCDTSINLCKFTKSMTSSSVKRVKEDTIDQLQAHNKVMKYKKLKRTDIISSKNLLAIENKSHDTKIKITEIDKCTTSFFKETDLYQMSYELQVENSTPVNLTLKQKLLKAMSTIKYRNNTDKIPKNITLD